MSLLVQPNASVAEARGHPLKVKWQGNSRAGPRAGASLQPKLPHTSGGRMHLALCPEMMDPAPKEFSLPSPHKGHLLAVFPFCVLGLRYYVPLKFIC